MELTRYGLWIGHGLLESDYGEAAQLAEDLGFGALWLGASPRLSQLRPMLEATGTIVIASGIVNIWQYDPVVLAGEYASLEAAFPGRTLLGIGIGHPEMTSEYAKPITKTMQFLDGIAGSPTPVPRERMVLAALGPKMLDLSLERTLGTHPYFTSPAHTRMARERLGSAALIAPEQAVVVDTDGQSGRAAARDFAARYLRMGNYASNLKRLGYTEADIAEGGSDQLVNELVPQGSSEQVASAVRAHLTAGADHVCVQAVGVDGVPRREWTELAAALID